MQIPVRITFRHMDTSAAVEARVHELAARLTRVSDKIIDCHVTIEAPPAHQHKGAPFSVRIDLTGPGGHLSALKGNSARPEHQDVYVALRDAFDAIKRQLEETVRALRDHTLPRTPLSST
jgi:ribosome-associated translation inhibitor RaiA